MFCIWSIDIEMSSPIFICWFVFTATNPSSCIFILILYVSSANGMYSISKTHNLRLFLPWSEQNYCFWARIRTRTTYVNKVLQWTFIVAMCNDPYCFKHESRNRPASHVRPPLTGYEMLGYWVVAYTIWPTWSGSHYVCACVC